MTIEKLLRGIVLAGVFLLPFVVFIIAQSLFFPFITGKNFTFRIIVEIITGSYLALVLLYPAYRPRRSWLLGAFALFVVIVALADALGVYPFKSFWSNYERMDGWVTLVHLFLYFVVASSTLTTEKLWRYFWYVSLVVSVAVGLYGLSQLVGIANLNPGFSSAARIDATFGNPIYLAVYMLFHIGIAAILWAREWAERPAGRRLVISTLYGSVIVFSTLILFLTGTRGTILGLIGGTLLGALLIALSSREARRIALAVIAIFIVLGGTFFFVRDQAWVQQIPSLQRLATISLEDGTTRARFMNWGMAWEGVKERPILGWGQEHYAIVFDKYYNPQMYGQEQWFDRVHNVIFDWLVAAGFLGLFGYLAIYVAALLVLWRGDAFDVYERSILTGLLAAYFFHNLFVFDNIMSYILFVSILAYIAWRGGRAMQPLTLPSVPTRFTAVLVVGVVAVVGGSISYVNGQPIAENRTLLSALRPQSEGLAKNLEYFKKAVEYGSFGTQEVREQLAQAAAQVIRIDSIPLEVKQDFLDTAAREMSLQAERSPLDARFPLFLGALLNAAGDYESAAPVLERAHELSPGKQTILFEIAANRYARGDAEGALAAYKQAYELAPEFSEAQLYYAALAIRVGNDMLANELLASLIETGKVADSRIAAAYVARGRYDKITQIWEAHIKTHPADAQAYLTLAAAYYEIGNSAKAISTLEAAGSAIPEIKGRTDELIQQVRAGVANLE